MLQFVVFGSLFEHCEAMCADLVSMENVIFINDAIYSQNPIIRLLFSIHNSKNIEKALNLPFRQIWYKYVFNSKDYKKLVSHSGTRIFVFFDSNPNVYNDFFLSWLRSLPGNSVFCLLFVNTISTKMKFDLNFIKLNYTYIYTIDWLDADIYGFNYITHVHSKVELSIKCDEAYDITFAGGDKGRKTILEKIYRRAIEKDIVCDFTLFGSDSDVAIGINTQKLSYSDVLLRELQSRCILEINLPEQHAYSLRTIEAIMYNRKLITNNKSVKELPFYNDKFMLVFSSPDDIALDFCRNSVNVDYNYCNEYSPVNLLLDIEQRVQKDKLNNE